MADKILVTGAGGFIGSHLVERLLKEGRDVRAFLHYSSDGSWKNLEHLSEDLLSGLEVVMGDIADPFAVEKAVSGCSIVFHLAALIGIPYSYLAPHAYVTTNVVGTLNILQAGRKLGVDRILHTSTSETYGSAQYVPIDESHPKVGQSPYSASKIAADKLVESFWLSFETPVVTVRPFNTFGPRQSMRAVIPTIISQASLSDDLRLGSLDPVRDLTFVADTVAGLILASSARSIEGEVVNLGFGDGISIGGLVDLIGDLLGRKLNVVSDLERVRPGASEVMQLISDNSKAREMMGWQPKVTLREGLRQTIEFVTNNLDVPRASNYTV